MYKKKQLMLLVADLFKMEKMVLYYFALQITV